MRFIFHIMADSILISANTYENESNEPEGHNSLSTRTSTNTDKIRYNESNKLEGHNVNLNTFVDTKNT